jgi:hypothetical protein
MTQSNGKVLEIECSQEISERISIVVKNHILYKIDYLEIAGRERNLNSLPHYCVDAAVAIVLFDTTKNSSFEKAGKILEKIAESDINYKYLVGNKIDLLTTKKAIDPVLQSEAQILAKIQNAEYFTCK